MKVLYANPEFLDYRIPFYKRLNELFSNDFHVLYSVMRYKRDNRTDLLDRLKRELGDNAHPFNKEYCLNTYSMWGHQYSRERGKNIPFTLGLLRAVRRIKPEVVISEGFFQWTPLMILYCTIFRTPLYIGYERTPHTERNNSWLKTLHRKISDWFITGYLVNGSETSRYLQSIGVKKSKIHVGGMCADSKGLVESVQSMPAEEKAAFKAKYQKGNGLVYLFVGQIVVRKGVKYLLQAWTEHIKNYPDDTLVLVGVGDLLEGFKKEYAHVTSIRFEGTVHYQQVYKYYATADVAFMPTIEDNWSLVVPEAMACGLPVATSIYNGCHPELIEEGVNGTVFDTFDNGSMIKALDFFHHHDLKKLGMMSIEKEKPFDTDHSAQRVYEALTKK